MLYQEQPKCPFCNEFTHEAILTEQYMFCGWKDLNHACGQLESFKKRLHLSGAPGRILSINGKLYDKTKEKDLLCLRTGDIHIQQEEVQNLRYQRRW
jgi:hypothetical protein